MFDFFQIITQKVAIVITAVIITVTGVFQPTAHTLYNAPVTVATDSAVISESPSPSFTIVPTITPKPKVKAENTPTPIPAIPETQSNELPQIKGIQKPKVDSAVGIEQCRTYAKEKRKEEERKVNEQYAQSEPAIVELAAAQTNSETETAALKYGKITQSQVVRRTEVFEKLLSQGVPTDQAGIQADAAGSAYSTYLRALHDWAVGELNKWNTALKDKFDTYESQVYQACLSTL